MGIETSSRQTPFQEGLIFIFLMWGCLEPEILPALSFADLS